MRSGCQSKKSKLTLNWFRSCGVIAFLWAFVSLSFGAATIPPEFMDTITLQESAPKPKGVQGMEIKCIVIGDTDKVYIANYELDGQQYNAVEIPKTSVANVSIKGAERQAFKNFTKEWAEIKKVAVIPSDSQPPAFYEELLKITLNPFINKYSKIIPVDEALDIQKKLEDELEHVKKRQFRIKDTWYDLSQWEGDTTNFEVEKRLILVKGMLENKTFFDETPGNFVVGDFQRFKLFQLIDRYMELKTARHYRELLERIRESLKAASAVVTPDLFVAYLNKDIRVTTAAERNNISIQNTVYAKSVVAAMLNNLRDKLTDVEKELVTAKEAEAQRDRYIAGFSQNIDGQISENQAGDLVNRLILLYNNYSYVPDEVIQTIYARCDLIAPIEKQYIDREDFDRARTSNRIALKLLSGIPDKRKDNKTEKYISQLKIIGEWLEVVEKTPRWLKANKLDDMTSTDALQQTMAEHRVFLENLQREVNVESLVPIKKSIVDFANKHMSLMDAKIKNCEASNEGCKKFDQYLAEDNVVDAEKALAEATQRWPKNPKLSGLPERLRDQTTWWNNTKRSIKGWFGKSKPSQ